DDPPAMRRPPCRRRRARDVPEGRGAHARAGAERARPGPRRPPSERRRPAGGGADARPREDRDAGAPAEEVRAAYDDRRPAAARAEDDGQGEAGADDGQEAPRTVDSTGV